MRTGMKWARQVPLLTLAVAGSIVLLRGDFAAAAATLVDSDPAPYRARYQVSRNGDTLGQAVVTLSREGAAWRLRSETHGTEGLAALARVEIVEESNFRIAQGRPETMRYSYRQKAAWKNRQRNVTVDANAGTIVSTDKDRTHRFGYRPAVVDRQLVTLALSMDLARGALGDLVYRVVDRDELEEERYRVGARETIDSPVGKLRTIRVIRLRATPGRTTESWLAVDRGFVPVRIVQSEPGGESFELKLLALKR